MDSRKPRATPVCREQAIAAAADYFDTGAFFEDMSRRIAIRTESQLFADRAAEMDVYLDEIQRTLEPMGYHCAKFANPSAMAGPLPIAERIEDPSQADVLTYGHGDVVNGMEGQWDEDRDPWTLTEVGDRLYGRGIADNKGQHSVNIAGLAAVLKTRGKLGFNSKILIENGEECGSLGLADFARLPRINSRRFSDFSDGPRFNASAVCVYGLAWRLCLRHNMRASSGRTPFGKLGRPLPNPAIILAHAVASITDKRGHPNTGMASDNADTGCAQGFAECEWEAALLA